MPEGLSPASSTLTLTLPGLPSFKPVQCGGYHDNQKKSQVARNPEQLQVMVGGNRPGVEAHKAREI